MAPLPVAVTEQLWNEQQLLQPLRAPAWRSWRYREPVVVLGCAQRRLLAEAGAHCGPELLLRASGGGAVLTGPWMLGLSVALPAHHPLVAEGPVGSYRWLGEQIAQLLQGAGIAAQAIAPQQLRQPRPAPGPVLVDWACFGGLSPWEVLVRGRKIAGLAQVRRRTGVLLVGGLLLSPSPWPLLCRALGRDLEDAARLAELTTCCTDQAGAAFDVGAFERALLCNLQARLGRAACPA